MGGCIKLYAPGEWRINMPTKDRTDKAALPPTPLRFQLWMGCDCESKDGYEDMHWRSDLDTTLDAPALRAKLEALVELGFEPHQVDILMALVENELAMEAAIEEEMNDVYERFPDNEVPHG